jgi:hypothetical protein
MKALIMNVAIMRAEWLLRNDVMSMMLKENQTEDNPEKKIKKATRICIDKEKEQSKAKSRIVGKRRNVEKPSFLTIHANMGL